MHIRNPIEWAWEEVDIATSSVGSASVEEYWPKADVTEIPDARRITLDDLRIALARGLDDFAANRTDVIMFCVIYPVIGLAMAAAVSAGGLLPLLFPLASGFALVGPFAAIGLYEMSRRRERDGETSWTDAFGVFRSPSIGAILVLGAGLVGLFFLWLLAAEAIYDATLGPLPPVSLAGFLHGVFTTSAGWAMIAAGIGTGFVFAVVVLAISVVSFPLLLDRPTEVGLAVRTSFKTVWRNPGPMAVWGMIVATGLVLGSLPGFVGLVLVMPILGHSTWHLYRRVVWFR